MPNVRSRETGFASAGTRRRARASARRDERAWNGSVGRGDGLFQDVAKAWIRNHQDAALLAAFACGVFIGAWMRG